MAIATIADLKRVLDSEPPKGNPRIGIGSKGQISENSAQAFLDGMEGYILAKLGFTPEATAFIKTIHAKLSAYDIWIHIIDRSTGEGEIPEYVKEWKAWAEKQLDDAKKGEIQIIPLDAAPSADAFSSEFRQVIDEEVTMEHDEWVKLDFFPILTNSELVYSAANKGGTLYVKGTDYQIKYKQREIKALSAGGITDLQKVYVTYMHLESKQIYKDPERVEWADRATTPNWEGLFGG